MLTFSQQISGPTRTNKFHRAKLLVIDIDKNRRGKLKQVTDDQRFMMIRGWFSLFFTLFWSHFILAFDIMCVIPCFTLLMVIQSLTDHWEHHHGKRDWTFKSTTSEKELQVPSTTSTIPLSPTTTHARYKPTEASIRVSLFCSLSLVSLWLCMRDLLGVWWPSSKCELIYACLCCSNSSAMLFVEL